MGPPTRRRQRDEDASGWRLPGAGVAKIFTARCALPQARPRMDLLQILSRLREAVAVELFVVGGTVVTGASLVTFALIVLVTLWVSRTLQRVTRRVLEKGGLRRDDTLATATSLLHYAVLVAGLGVALQAIGISLTTVFAAGAVVAVAIGFALQNILQNFVSGIILLAERSITETDVLEVEGTMVRIERIGARSTVARTREDEELIIPNATLVQSTVKNLTLSDPVYRVRSRVGVAYASDMRLVEEVLAQTALAVPGRHPDKDPVIYLAEFGDSSVVWEVSIWATEPWTAPVTRSDLNKAIWWALKDAGITIAFPQLDLHLDPSITQGLQSRIG